MMSGTMGGGLDKRAASAQAAVHAEHGQLVVFKGCDETEEEAIVRAGAQNWTGTIVIIRRFCLTAAECEARRVGA